MSREQEDAMDKKDAPAQPVAKAPSPMQSKLLASIQKGVATAGGASRSSRFAQAKTVEASTVQAAIAEGGSQAAALVQGHPVAGLLAPALGPASGTEAQKYVPGMAVKVGMCLEVELEDLLESPVQPRVFFDEDRLADIKASLAQHGQQQLGQALLPAPGASKLTLREGHTRRRLLRELGKPTMRVEIVQPGRTEEEEAVLAREVNDKRCAITVFDMAVRLTEFLDKCDGQGQPAPPGESLAHRFGLGSASRVSEFTTIGKLPRALLQEMFKAGFKRSTAYLVARHHKRSNNVAESLKLVEQIVREKMPVRRLEALLGEEGPEETARTAATAKARQKSLAVTLVEGALKGEVKLFDTGVVQLKLKPTAQGQGTAVALHARLQQLLRELGLDIKAADAPSS
jgi:ParB-like chromosome segregation protein Spo0J